MADLQTTITLVTTSLLAIDKAIYTYRNRNGNSNESKIRRVVKEELDPWKEEVKGRFTGLENKVLNIDGKVDDLKLEVLEVKIKQNLVASMAAGR